MEQRDDDLGVITSPAGASCKCARAGADKDARPRELTIPFLTDNVRAVITDVDASSAAKKAKGSSSPSASGDLVASGGPITETRDTKVNLTWKVDNPDKDELRYRVQYRLVGTTTWYDLLKPGEKLGQLQLGYSGSPEGRIASA
jgi:hypothetical protein